MGLNHSITNEGWTEPPPTHTPIIVQHTSDLCILKTLAYKKPPPILVCVSVVTCAAVRGRALHAADCSEVTQRPLIPMPYIYTSIWSTEKVFCFYFVTLCVQQQEEWRWLAAEILSTDLFLKRRFACQSGISDVQSKFVLRACPVVVWWRPSVTLTDVRQIMS